ncbi:ATP phosphoribosyltransferase [Capsulimonas corticalis]|uniref:ATP phosphoribosyltransferase n=1 Tax=Capsulimonas corticalis TaxID=2219043 RepID=A0A402CRM6_9BACT|nr:ATP phosphoribosyltransferase [Capsulimonas corticalis]
MGEKIIQFDGKLSTVTKLRIGVPKGSLQEATFALFKKAGWDFRVSTRSYQPVVDDDELEPVLLRAQEIPRYVAMGVLDVGLTGHDNVIESEADVYEVSELIYSKATSRPYRWVLAVPNNSPISGPKDLQGKRIATELVNVTKRYLEKHGVTAHVEFSWGATEVKVPDLVDAIVEGTETGSTLAAHGLKIVDTLLESTTRLVANKESWQDDWKQRKIENIALLLQGALDAETLVGLKMNVSKENLDAVIKLLSSLRKPTISPLEEDGWVALETIIPEKTVRHIVPELRRNGAQGLVEYPLNKVIY